MEIFQSAWWLPGPHLQTIWPNLYRQKPAISIFRERLELKDGDFLDLDWTTRKTGPIVLILHGLAGSLNSPYVTGFLKAIHDAGWRGVLMNYRGCSGTPNRLPRDYHSGETRDVDYVVKEISQRYPRTPLAVIGVSLGGNVLLKWLGETQENNPLTAAMAISVPFELPKAATRINQGFSKFYQWKILNYLRDFIEKKYRVVQAPIDLSPLKEVKTFWEFDTKFTAPMNGFKDVHDYYQKASSRQYLHAIRIPSLIVHSKDDPFVGVSAIPQAHELSKFVELEITNGGGHVGFVAGNNPLKPIYWLEERAIKFLHQYF
jgi:predicted alpha/beta-fold hydrolase